MTNAQYMYNICVCVCIKVSTNAEHFCSSTCTCSYVWVHEYIHVYMYEYIHVYYMYEYIHVYMYEYIHVYMYEYMYVYTEPSLRVVWVEWCVCWGAVRQFPGSGPGYPHHLPASGSGPLHCKRSLQEQSTHLHTCHQGIMRLYVHVHICTTCSTCIL